MSFNFVWENVEIKKYLRAHISINKFAIHIPAQFAEYLPDKRARLVKHVNMMAFINDKDGDIQFFKQGAKSKTLKSSRISVINAIKDTLGIKEDRAKLKTWVDDGYIVFTKGEQND